MSEEAPFETVFHLFRGMLEFAASLAGISFEALAVALFIFVWPAVTLALIVVVQRQRRILALLRTGGKIQDAPHETAQDDASPVFGARDLRTAPSFSGSTKPATYAPLSGATAAERIRLSE